MVQPLRTPGGDAQRRGTLLAWIGGAVLLVAGLVSWITYSNAREEGGSYVVLLGPLLLGAGLLVAGLVDLSRSRSAGQQQWLPDPTGRHQRRYWDGARWSDRVSDQGEESSDPAGSR